MVSYGNFIDIRSVSQFIKFDLTTDGFNNCREVCHKVTGTSLVSDSTRGLNYGITQVLRSTGP